METLEVKRTGQKQREMIIRMKAQHDIKETGNQRKGGMEGEEEECSHGSEILLRSVGTRGEDHFTQQLLLLLPPGSWTAAAVAAFYTERKLFACPHTTERLERLKNLSKLSQLDTKNILSEKGDKGRDKRDETKNTAAD